MMFHRRSAAVLVGLVFALGCAEQGPRRHPVTGTVTWEGEPVAEGDILFYPQQAGQHPDGGLIRDGRFEAKVKAGQHRVEIRATRDSPGRDNPQMRTPPREDYIPSRYNTESTLTAEVTAVGPNQLEFALKSDD